MAQVTRLQGPTAPNLPVATTVYSQEHFDVLNNVLRLYFNRLDQTISALIGGNGGAYLQFPFFSGYQNGHTELTASMTNVSTADIQVTSTAGFDTAGFLIIDKEVIQYTGTTATTFTGITRGVKSTTNVAHNSGDPVSEAAGVSAGSTAALELDTIVASNQITCTVPDSKIYFNGAGIYNIQFSIQLLNYTTAEDNVTVWIKKNGSDLANSASVQLVNAKHGTSPGATILALNFVDEFTTDDYIELYWTSDSGNTVIGTYPPGTSPVHPASPSMILTVTFVSAPQA
jgi:hypothetical protein